MVDARCAQIEVPEDLFVDMSEFEFSERMEYANSYVSFGLRKHAGVETSVVLKEPTRLSSHSESDPEKIYFLCDFVNEVVAQSRIKHPCILPVIGIKLFDKDGQFAPGIITPRTKGSADELQEMDEEDAWIWGIGVADAMALVHAHSIMHRDIKPANIFIGELQADSDAKTSFSKWPFLGDFGYAVSIEEGDLCFYPFGTPGYKAPEMAAREDGCAASYDAQCDVFSFGVTMWAITEDKVFQDGEKQQELLDSGGKLEFSTESGQQMKELLSKCMDIDPEARPQFEYVSKELRLLASKMKKSVSKRVETFVNALEREKEKIGNSNEEVFVFGHDLGNDVMDIVSFLEVVLGRLFAKSFEESDGLRAYFPLSNFVCSYLARQPYAHGKDVKDLLVVLYNSERELLDIAQRDCMGGLARSRMLTRPSLPMPCGLKQLQKEPSASIVQPHFSWENRETELKVSVLRSNLKVRVPEIVRMIQFNFTSDKKTVVLHLMSTGDSKR